MWKKVAIATGIMALGFFLALYLMGNLGLPTTGPHLLIFGLLAPLSIAYYLVRDWRVIAIGFVLLLLVLSFFVMPIHFP